jgi:hypothetical protein
MTENKIKVTPQYSYDYNKILNEQYTNEDNQIKNFSSLLSDKDRFLIFLPLIAHNQELIEKVLDYKLTQTAEFYVVRCEKFNSFSLPITIEYSISPEEMFLYLIKEILKTSITDRFPDEETREQALNNIIEHILEMGIFGNNNFKDFTKTLHENSQKQFPNYKSKKIDFSNLTMKKHLIKLYDSIEF